ncbi:hypothetical protein PUN28_016170 [Cardiocondyla obscurior]|uniref:Uncharacterized protein n=1 Tax=Cardiocondyla obscurior TaxID=286306 RepID=A0AAW2ERB2_9HYME
MDRQKLLCHVFWQTTPADKKYTWRKPRSTERKTRIFFQQLRARCGTRLNLYALPQRSVFIGSALIKSYARESRSFLAKPLYRVPSSTGVDDDDEETTTAGARVKSTKRKSPTVFLRPDKFRYQGSSSK